MTDIELLDYTEAVFSAPTYNDNDRVISRSFSCSPYKNEAREYVDCLSNSRSGNYDRFNNILKGLNQPFYL